MTPGTLYRVNGGRVLHTAGTVSDTQLSPLCGAAAGTVYRSGPASRWRVDAQHRGIPTCPRCDEVRP